MSELKLLKCTECGGAVVLTNQFSHNIISAECQYCHMSYVLDFGSGSSAPQSCDSELDRLINGAYEWLRTQHDSTKALELFRRAQNYVPSDYRGFWGELMVVTYELDSSKMPKVTDQKISAIEQRVYNCPMDEKAEVALRGAAFEYKKSLQNRIIGRQNYINENLETAETRRDELMKGINTIDSDIPELLEKQPSKEDMKNMAIIIAGLIVLFLIFSIGGNETDEIAPFVDFLRYIILGSGAIGAFYIVKHQYLGEQIKNLKEKRISYEEELAEVDRRITELESEAEELMWFTS